MLIDIKWWDLAERPTDARLSLIYHIVYNLILIEAIQYVTLQKNLISLQQILANKKYMYYEMSFFPRTVKDWNSLPKILLSAFKAGVVKVEHHLPPGTCLIRFHSPLLLAV